MMYANERISLTEKQQTYADGSGFEMQLIETSLNSIDLRWGSYINPTEKVLSVESGKCSVVSHFQLYDPVVTSKRETLKANEFVVYRESAEPYEFTIAPTKNGARLFFEMILTEELFTSLVNEESAFLNAFNNYKKFNTLSPPFMGQMIPKMHAIISDMQQTPYTGYLKGLYLEAKAIELFLSQVDLLDHKKTTPAKLSSHDESCLYDIKKYIEQNYLLPLSIIGLSKKAGINQTKLKKGFKQLFNHPVFEYINHLRMEEAKRLLLEEKCYINEVAYKIGYQHPHHFTIAFKKKFGILPSHLKG